MNDPTVFACPICGAKPGERCVNMVGAKLGHSHRGRRNAAEAAFGSSPSVTCHSCGERYSPHTATVCPFCFAWPNRQPKNGEVQR